MWSPLAKQHGTYTSANLQHVPVLNGQLTPQRAPQIQHPSPATHQPRYQPGDAAMAHYVRQLYAPRSSPPPSDPAILGQVSLEELVNFGQYMMEKIVADSSYKQMLVDIAQNPYSNAIDRRVRLMEYGSKVIKPKCYDRYINLLKPVDISREDSLCILDVLKTLELYGLCVSPQDSAFDDMDNAALSLPHLLHEQQKESNGFSASLTEQWVEQLVDTRKLGTNYHIMPAKGSANLKSNSDHGKPFSRCSVTVHPEELGPLIALMPDIFARYGDRLRQAKVTAPAMQGKRSESMIFYFTDPDDQNQTVTRSLFRFLRKKLPLTNWAPVAPGMMSIVENGVIVGGYAEECYTPGKPKVSLGQRRAAQVTQAIENCLSKYPGDLATCKLHFPEELKKVLRDDGYNPESPALLIR